MARNWENKFSKQSWSTCVVKRNLRLRHFISLKRAFIDLMDIKMPFSTEVDLIQRIFSWSWSTVPFCPQHETDPRCWFPEHKQAFSCQKLCLSSWHRTSHSRSWLCLGILTVEVGQCFRCCEEVALLSALSALHCLDSMCGYLTALTKCTAHLNPEVKCSQSLSFSMGNNFPLSLEIRILGRVDDSWTVLVKIWHIWKCKHLTSGWSLIVKRNCLGSAQVLRSADQFDPISNTRARTWSPLSKLFHQSALCFNSLQLSLFSWCLASDMHTHSASANPDQYLEWTNYTRTI